MLSLGLLNWIISDPDRFALFSHYWWLVVLFVAFVIFIETGIVILAFLPGDTVLFACGTFLGMSGINPILAMIITTTAAILGDWLNYYLGSSRIGQHIISRGWIKPQTLQKTRDYFDNYGSITITLARFIPIIRSAAPFLAGMAGMNTKRFVFYNILGGTLWCFSLLGAGYFLGRIAWVKENIPWISIGIVVLSLPVILFIKYHAQKPIK